MKHMKHTIVMVLAALLFLGIGFVAAAQDYTPWMKLKADYQASFVMDLEDAAGFNMDRARIGVIGSFAKNFFFEVSVDGKYTQDGKGTELKKAYLQWEFLPKHSVSFGGIQMSFTRPISGTEFNFINYDITTTPNAYQYGIMFEGRFLKQFAYSVAIANGEGLKTDNIGKGFLYSGRVEFLLRGVRDYFDGSAEITDKMILNIGYAFAMDNKAETADGGLTYEYFSGYYYLLDVSFKLRGLAVFGQYNMNLFDRKEDGTYWGGTDGNVKKAVGGYLQASFNLKDIIGYALEPVVKYEYWDNTVNEGLGNVKYNLTRLCLGLTYYIKGHDLKFNLEYRRVLNDDKVYFLKKPSDHFLGIQATHKFGSGKIGL